MKTEITFTFNEEDGDDKIRRIVNADNAYRSLFEIGDNFRVLLMKYTDDLTKETYNQLEIFHEKFFKILEENDINLGRDYP